MNEAALMVEIQRDLRKSTREMVIYLEGRTDPASFFALLGVPEPSDGLHQGVFVRGLPTDEGSGANAVAARVALTPRFPSSKLLGIVDGDGMTLDDLAPEFDDPHPGPLFRWKAYSIENLVTRTGWPLDWGDEPDWTASLASYGPYVALNRVGIRARAILEGLGLEKYTNPSQGSPLKTAAEFAAVLAAGKARLLNFDVEREYAQELETFESAVLRSLDEAHALLNGKWLFRHLAPSLSRKKPDLCRSDWLAHARTAGGLAEVREWWRRVTGDAP